MDVRTRGMTFVGVGLALILCDLAVPGFNDPLGGDLWVVGAIGIVAGLAMMAKEYVRKKQT